MKNIIPENWRHNRAIRDTVVIAVMFVILILISFYSDFLLTIDSKSLIGNKWISKVFIIIVILFISLVVFSIRRWVELRQEIIKRKDFEKKMYKSRAELQAVLDGVPDMIMQVDTNTRILWANRAVLERDPSAIGKTCGEAFSIIGESVIETYSKWAMVTGIIERGIKYQPMALGDKGGSYWEAIGIPLKGKDNTIYGAIAIARDVTERMRIEHTSTLLSSIIESTDDAIYGMTFDSTVLSWNLGAENIYGYLPGEIIGGKGEKIVPPEQRVAFLKRIEKVIRTQEIERFEAERIRKDNKKIFVSITICPFVDATGRKIGVSAIDRDITQRKIAEEALIESESRYRELFANMSSGVAVFESLYDGIDFILRDINQGGEIIENKKREELIGKRLNEFFVNSNVQEIFDTMKSVHKTGKPDQLLITFHDKGKIIRWRDNRIYKLPSGELISVYDDITERVTSEDALKSSEEKFRTLVSTAPDGIVLTDSTGVIIEVNPAFADIFGYGRDEILGKNFVEFFESKENKKRAEKILSGTRKDKNINQIEISTIAKENREIFIELSAAHLIDDKGNLDGMIAVTRDISIRKHYEQELKESREQLRNLAIHLQSAREEERKNIAFEIHDELGYALTALKLDLAWLIKKTKVKEGALFTKSKSMAELIDTTINKVRTISTQLRPSILDHFGLIAAIEWQASEFQKRTAIRCKVDIEPKDMSFKDPYSTAIFRIFQETLTNIARHSKASRVNVSFYRKKKFIELKVNDNGIGLSGDKLSHHKSLGLIGIRERANSLGGEVKFISENGEGTTVILTVPVNEILKD
jgi:PAS domain S-box-containing protein